MTLQSESEQVEGIVLGTEVRMNLLRSSKLWSQERRAAFLLRPEVTGPASVDVSVWPRPEGSSKKEDLSLNLEEQLIEITVFNDQRKSEYWRNLACTYTQSSRSPNHEYKFLGFDIADQSFVSGLNNCRLEEKDLAKLRNIGGPLVNSFGLLNNIREAVFLSKIYERLIPEHAPFFPFQIRTLTVRLSELEEIESV